jgi:hypothetical protein
VAGRGFDVFELLVFKPGVVVSTSVNWGLGAFAYLIAGALIAALLRRAFRALEAR